MKHQMDDIYWDQWIDNDEVGCYKLLDYKAYYLSIRRLDMETDDPEFKNKYRLYITGTPKKEVFDSPQDAKEWARTYIDKRVEEQHKRDRARRLPFERKRKNTK